MRVLYLNHQEIADAVRLCCRAFFKCKEFHDKLHEEKLEGHNKQIADAEAQFKETKDKKWEQRAERLRNKTVRRTRYPTFPVVIQGDPGGGKTALVEQFCDELNDASDEGFNYYPVDAENNQKEDFGGYPRAIDKEERMVFWGMKNLPWKNETGIACFDDVDGCDWATQSAIKALMNTRTINGNTLSPNCYCICTANGISDPTRTTPLSKAFVNRCISLYLRPAENAIEYLGDKIQETAELYTERKYTDYEEVATDTLRSRDMSRWIIAAFRKETMAVKRAVLAGCVGSKMADVLLMVAKRKVCLDDILNAPDKACVNVSIDDFHLLEKELNKMEKSFNGADAIATIAPKVRVWLERLPDSLEEHRNRIGDILKLDKIEGETEPAAKKKRK